jgi:hypothetical protein
MPMPLRIHSVLTLLPKHIDRVLINDTFDKLGPTARLCIEYLSGSLELRQLQQYKGDVDETINNLTGDQLWNLFRDATSLATNAMSHKIWLLSRKQQEDVGSRATVIPITPSIQSRLANRFRTLQWDEQICLYEHFARVPESRKMAGSFYEGIAQRRLQEGIDIDLVPMVKLDTSSEKMPQWHSSHMFLSNTPLEASRQRALGQQLKLRIYPTQTIEFTSNPLPIVPGIFYVPEAPNHPAYGSFLLLDNHFIIFQFTIGFKHGIKPKLIHFLEKCAGIPPMEKWIFVFVIPPGLTLKCPQPRDLKLRALPLYSAVVRTC